MNREWSIEIKPKNGWFDLNLKELIDYRDLVYLFVKRNFSTRYKQTILGPLWLIINPLITVILYSFVFGSVAGISTEGVPSLPFYMASNAIWSYFASCINGTANTFTNNAGLFGKVYFPRLAMPVSAVLTSMFDLMIQFGMLVITLLLFLLNGTVFHISAWIIITPILILQCALLGLGFGIIVSSLTTKYRDLNVLVGFGVQLWMYASPVVYTVSNVPERFHGIYMLNPIAPIITIFRYALFGIGEIPYTMWMISWVTTIIVVFLGVILFSRVEKTFMDTV